MRWMLNGTVLEDIAQLSRVEEQVSRFVSTNKNAITVTVGADGKPWMTLAALPFLKSSPQADRKRCHGDPSAAVGWLVANTYHC